MLDRDIVVIKHSHLYFTERIKKQYTSAIWIVKHYCVQFDLIGSFLIFSDLTFSSGLGIIIVS